MKLRKQDLMFCRGYLERAFQALDLNIGLCLKL